MKLRLFAVGSVFLALLLWVAYLMTLTPPRRALLVYGSDVREFRRDYGILPDFDHYLSARLEAERFPAFAQQLGLTRAKGGVSNPGIGWGDCPEPWWNESLTLDSVYVRYEPEHEFFAVAKMQGGRVYYRAVRW